MLWLREMTGAHPDRPAPAAAHRPLDDLTRMQVVQNYLFSQLTADELSTVLARAAARQLAPGDTVFRQGEAAAHFFLVTSGQVRLYRISPLGEEKIIELIGPGALFAEAVSFMGGYYPVHAAAVDQVRLVSFAFEDLDRALHESPGLAFRMMGSMAMRIHGLVNEIDHLASGSAGQRLVYYLLDLLREAPDPQRIHLRAPKNVIASRIGVKPETLSRLLARLKDAGILEVHDEWLQVRDGARLKAVLENPSTLF
ncbi:MAG: Crp/Fnr family transcriptional regulator [Pseudomonadota bacterium]